MPQPATEIKIGSKIVAGLIPSHQRRIVALAREGHRPGAICGYLGLGVGGCDRVWSVLRHYGLAPADRRMDA